jgi:iron complex outermembrane recepter protein
MNQDLRVRVSIVLAAAACAPPIAFSQEAAQPTAAGTLEEIVVTARMREEDLQETPISITAVTGRALEDRQIITTQGLDQLAPNLVVSQGQGVSGNASAGSYFIRGIGQIDFLLNTDPGVGLYVDGVYVARSLGSIMDLIDLERVEVLRGPQGTLFGRNTIGGAISLVSQPPSEDFRADTRLTYGTFNRDARATLSGPISDAAAGSIAVLWRDREGWVDRISDGTRLGDEESFAARGAVRFAPTSGVTVDLAADFLDSEGTSTPANVVQVVETASFPGFHNGALVGPPCVPPPGSLADPRCFNPQWEASDRFDEQGTFESGTTLDVWGASLNASWEIAPSLTLRAIAGYRETDALGSRDGDHTPILIQNTTDTWEHEQWSQELQLLGSSFGDRFKWILGAYHFTEEGENLNFVTFPVVAIQSGGSVDNENTAAFGQATVDLTERLSLTAGLRWTDETKTFLPDQIVLADPTGAFPPGSVPGFRLVPFVESRTSITETTPMANLAYQWSERLMTYVSYSEGFKSGGFTQRIFPPLPAPPPFDPEFATAYEAGFKWNSEDGRLRLNGAAYTTDYTDLQVQVLVGVQPLTANAGEADVQGFELELEAAPTADFSLNLGVGYTDAEYTELDPTVLATGVTLDSRFAQVPEWTASLGAGYDFRPGFGGVVTPRIDLAHRSAAYMNAANTASMRQDAYTLINASLTWQSADERWRVSVFGQNLGDEEYFVGGFADLVDQGYAEVLLGRPLEWGVSLSYRY